MVQISFIFVVMMLAVSVIVSVLIIWRMIKMDMQAKEDLKADQMRLDSQNSDFTVK